MQNHKSKVYLIDASIFIFRSYYAMPNEFFDVEGKQINAVYGFGRFLARFLKQTNASNIAIAFDESLSTSFRNEIYPAYKANREPAPIELKNQFSLCRELAQLLGISIFSDSCYEADDLLGTLHQLNAQDDKVIYLVSGDKDLAQLLRVEDYWWDFGKSAPLSYAEVTEKLGVRPDQVCDFLALAGDKVDNIPGVLGVGIKTAQALLKHFGTLDEIIKRHREIAFLSFRGAKSCQQKIQNHTENALLSRQLSKIVLDVPMENDDIMKKKQSHNKELLMFMGQMNFGPLLRRQLTEAAQL
ncbi:MAG: exodeoxyribonuclease IX [Proteobacteria bacterium]|nr:exodeoxyribonuclease IX [Pseudomonadota bacterium]